nr:hypothetical protein [Mixta theicola]
MFYIPGATHGRAAPRRPLPYPGRIGVTKKGACRSGVSARLAVTGPDGNAEPQIEVAVAEVSGRRAGRLHPVPSGMLPVIRNDKFCRRLSLTELQLLNSLI